MLASWLLHSHGAFSHFSFSENHDHARDSWHDCCHGCRDHVSTYTCLQEKILNPETLRWSPFVLLLMLPLIVSRSPPSGAPPQGSRRSRRCRVPGPLSSHSFRGAFCSSDVLHILMLLRLAMITVKMTVIQQLPYSVTPTWAAQLGHNVTTTRRHNDAHRLSHQGAAIRRILR